MNSSETHPLVAPILQALTQVYDPEFGISIYDLGLIYDVSVNEAATAVIKMTLTSMYCPAGDVITVGAQRAAESVPGIRRAQVDLVWEPLWTPELLTPHARTQLGWK